MNISEDEISHQLIKELRHYLADLAIVYFKTHVFHWNVEGEDFYSLHLLFEKFYKELWVSMDDIAERIRALGDKAPRNYKELLEGATIEESVGAPVSQVMIKMLKEDYHELAKKAILVAGVANKQKDPVTENLMLDKAAYLEKAAWILRSSLVT